MRSPAVLRRAGFTLVEVMIALAILGLGLVILVKSVGTNISSAASSFHMGIATDLARGKMYDLEEQLLQDGFQDSEQDEDGDFSEEGWPRVTWKAVIEPVELPSYEKLQAISQGGGAGSGSGSGSDGDTASDKFQSSALGSMMGMMGGGGGETAQEAETGGFIQSQYTMIQQVLKASIRKITLTVSWSTGLHDDEMEVILYVTDPAGMQKTLGNLGL